MHRVLRHVSHGTRIALVSGALLGVLLTAWLSSTEYATVLLRGSWAWSVCALFLGSVLALVAAVALLPIELLLGLLESKIPALGRARSVRLYAGLLVVLVAWVHTFFTLGFQVLRDLATRRGLVLIGASVVAALALGGFVVRWASRGVRDLPETEGRQTPFWLTILAVAVTVALAIVSQRLLASELATKHQGPAADIVPASGSADGATPARRNDELNVLLVSIDTLRADHLGVYGYGRSTTSHLDALAREGAFFRDARSSAPWTLPSHASMLTGMYPSRHGARFFSNIRIAPSPAAARLDAARLTLAEMLRATGRRTASITSVHWLGPSFGLGQGFDTVEMVKNNPASRAVDRAMSWLDEQPGQPFFLFLHLFDVHNYASPPEFDRRFGDPSYRGQLEGKARLLGSNVYDHLSPADLDYAIARYDAALAYVDAELSRLFAALRADARWERTLVVVTADHGEEFWEHGGSGHGFTLYDEQLRVPLIVKPPLESAPSEREPRFSAGVVDIVPTMLDYLGLPPFAHLDGVSLRPALEGSAMQPRVLHAEDTFHFNSYALIENGAKFIANRVPPADPLNPRLALSTIRSFYKFRNDELYDTGLDPQERNDLRSRELSRAEPMKERLLAHLAGARANVRMTPDEETVDQLRSLGYIR